MIGTKFSLNPNTLHVENLMYINKHPAIMYYMQSFRNLLVAHVFNLNVVYTSHRLHRYIVDALSATYNIIIHRPHNTTHVVQMQSNQHKLKKYIKKDPTTYQTYYLECSLHPRQTTQMYILRGQIVKCQRCAKTIAALKHNECYLFWSPIIMKMF